MTMSRRHQKYDSLFDTPVTASASKSSRETFGWGAAGWFWHLRRRGSAPEVRHTGRFPRATPRIGTRLGEASIAHNSVDGSPSTRR